jgi:hypothetical protein
MKTHYSHSYGAACSRKPHSAKWAKDGRQWLMTCKKCIYKAVTKNSQWTDSRETIVIKKVRCYGDNNYSVVFKDGRQMLLKDLFSYYKQKL